MKKTVYDELWYEVMSAVILYPMARAYDLARQV
jgi:hypothetical protein